MDNITWLLVGVLLVAAIGLGAFFLMQPQDKWIEADGVRVWKIPSNAENIEVNTAKSGAVKKLVQANKLIAFVGEAQGSGTIQDQEIAKLRAYSQIAELSMPMLVHLLNWLKVNYRMSKFLGIKVILLVLQQMHTNVSQTFLRQAGFLVLMCMLHGG